MKETQLSKSLVKIQITSEKYQTGFIFSNFGHILTAGHGFTVKTKNIFEIYLDCDGILKKYKAELIEFSYEKERFIDFAILKIVSTEYYNEIRPKLSLLLYNSSEHKNKSITLVGFANPLNADSASYFEGKILGTHPININFPNSKYWLQLKINTQFNLSGVSGAPVLLDNKVIGIQNLQATAGVHDCYAMPINCIKSIIIEKELRNQTDFFFMQPHFYKDFKSIIPSNLPSKKIRNALVISDNSNLTEIELMTTIRSKNKEEILSPILDKLYENLSKISNLKLFKPNIHIIPTSKDDIENLEEFIEQRNGEFADFGTYLRCIISTGSHIFNTNESNLRKTHKTGSHIIAVEIQEGVNNKILISKKLNFDIFFIIQFNSLQFIEDALASILIGIILDISFFWSVPGLRILMQDINSQKAFSKRKVEYAKQENLTLFDNIPIPESISYLSLAWTIQNFPGKNNQNMLLYYWHWKRFLSNCNGIFSQLKDKNLSIVELTMPEIIEAVKSLPGLKNQISIKRLKKKLDNPDLENVLCALIIIVKKPTPKKIKILRPYFESPGLLKNFAILPVSKVANVLPASDILKFFYFIKKD